MKKVELTKTEAEFIREMISLFLFEYPSVQDVLHDEDESIYTYTHDGKRITDNYEVTKYKLIHSIESKLNS